MTSNINRDDIVRLIRKGRRAETRGKALQGCASSILTSILGACFGGWMLMVAIGMLHTEWWPAMPTIGYWWAALTVGLLRGVFSRFPETKAKS